MAVARLVAILLFAVGASAHADEPRSADRLSESPYLIRHREVPAAYRDAFAFLEFLKYPEPPQDVFRSSEAPRWSVARLREFLREDAGLVISDVNDDSVRTYSRPQVEKSVSSRRGRPFVTLAHLAHIYAIPYTQYSELSFEPKGDGVVVRVAGWYALTFIRERGALKVARCDYVMLQGE